MKVLAVDLGRERGRDGVARRPAVYAVFRSRPSKLVELRTLRGHSRRAAVAPLYFVMIWLRRRSLRCRVSGRAARRFLHRIGPKMRSAQGLGRGDRQVRGDAGRALGSGVRGVRCTFVMICLP